MWTYQPSGSWGGGEDGPAVSAGASGAMSYSKVIGMKEACKAELGSNRRTTERQVGEPRG